MTLRRWIQILFFIITISIGIRFYIYVQQLTAGTPAISRPNGVEAFLPISALMSLKQFLLTGIYDSIHPAGLTIFIAILLMSVIFKKSFCSSVCPVGLVSELLSSLGFNYKVPKILFHIVSLTKYAILGFFFYIIVIQMSVRSISAFLNAPYNILADTKMLNFFIEPSRTTLITLAVLLVLTMLITNFWCRFLCPYGALLGLISTISPFKVKRNADACTDCRKCTSVCPMHIDVHKKKVIHSPECFGCHECVNNRTQQTCLTVTKLPKYRYVPLMVTALFAILILTAMTSNNWESKVPQETYKRFLQRAGQISH